jgi:DNA adenine methylase
VTRPLLKWAGGKRQLLPALRRFYPTQFGAYCEPFLGSAAVFFDLYNRGLLAGRPVRLSDTNPDLIACYTVVRDRPDEVINALERLAREHARRSPSHYYDIRDNHFNPQRRALASSSGTLSYTPALAAMLIYLNRTGYNGLFRLNASGEFNVPAGRYASPRICDEENIRAVAAALRQRDVSLARAAFDSILQDAQADDFVYFDPPYAPLSATARFTSYTAAGFTSADQQRLKELVVELAGRGCHVLLSNSTAPEITSLYARDKAVRRAGLRSVKVPARRAINSKAGRRGAVDEYLITTVRPGN